MTIDTKFTKEYDVDSGANRFCLSEGARIEDVQGGFSRSSTGAVRLRTRRDQVEEALEILKKLDYGIVAEPSEDEQS